VINTWFCVDGSRDWTWPRLRGEFHGSGCTLASAIAAKLAQGLTMEAALEAAQRYTYNALENAFSIAEGQSIPDRMKETA
jgi:hydroxymethylpyrimidine/phosphomethylpyrimidine kinase